MLHALCLSLFTGLQNTLQPFVEEFTELLSMISSEFDCFTIAGDLNIHIDNAEIITTKKSNFFKHVHGPSKNRGHTLDLLISRGLNISFIVIKDVALSDHLCIFFDILISVSTESRSVSVRKRCINCPLFSLWHSMEAVTFFLSPSSPLSSLLCSLVLRDSLCTALQTERLWI